MRAQKTQTEADICVFTAKRPGDNYTNEKIQQTGSKMNEQKERTWTQNTTTTVCFRLTAGFFFI